MFLLTFYLRIEEFIRLERLISGAHVSGIKSPSPCGSPSGAPPGSFSGLGPSAGVAVEPLARAVLPLGPRRSCCADRPGFWFSGGQCEPWSCHSMAMPGMLFHWYNHDWVPHLLQTIAENHLSTEAALASLFQVAPHPIRHSYSYSDFSHSIYLFETYSSYLLIHYLYHQVPAVHRLYDF